MSDEVDYNPYPNPFDEDGNFKEIGVIDADHLTRQREWSTMTFGPGDRTLGVIDHIKKELVEVLDDPKEWFDILILAFDGAWRSGLQPQEIIDGIIEKQGINEKRDWPDWRLATADKAIEHIR